MEIHRQVFTKEEYINIKKKWSDIVNSDEVGQITGAHRILYNVIRSKDPRSGFSEAKNKNRQEFRGYHGPYCRYKFERDRVAASFVDIQTKENYEDFPLLKVFGGVIKPDQLRAMVTWIKE